MTQKIKHFIANMYYRLMARLGVEVKLTAVEGEVSGVEEGEV